MNRTTLTVLGGALLLVLAGCSSAQGDGIASAGGTSSASQGAEQVSDEEQAREFAECMREHGIDLPDPEPDGKGGFNWGGGGIPSDDPDFGAAMDACQDKLPGRAEEFFADPEVQAQLREFAQCMRENGLPDFPDPDPNSGFGGAIAEMDRNSPAFQKAADACRDKLPERGGR